MTTGKAQFEIASFAIKPLTENGETIDPSKVEKMEFSQKTTTAKVGDKITLSIQEVGVDTTSLEYNFTSSDSNVAFVTNGVLHFIAEGEVTITAYCPYEPRLTESFTVVVEKQTDVDKEYYYPNEKDDEGTKEGCGSALHTTAWLCFIILAGSVCFKRRQEL